MAVGSARRSHTLPASSPTAILLTRTHSLPYSLTHSVTHCLLAFAPFFRIIFSRSPLHPLFYPPPIINATHPVSKLLLVALCRCIIVAFHVDSLTALQGPLKSSHLSVFFFVSFSRSTFFPGTRPPVAPTGIAVANGLPFSFCPIILRPLLPLTHNYQKA